MALGSGGIADRLTRAWRGLAERERWLLALLGLVALGGALTLVVDWNADRREARDLAAADLDARRNALVLSRARNAAAPREQLRLAEERSLKGADIWMAQVALEEHLANAVTAAGVPTPDVRLSDIPEDGPWPDTLHAEITGGYDGAALVRLLETLETGSPHGFVESLSVVGGETAEFHLTLAFPVALDRKGPAT